MALDFQYTRHCVRQLRRQPEHDAAAVGVRPVLRDGARGAASTSGYTLPNAGEQICGFVDLNPAFSTKVPFFDVQKASNFGDVSDVYTGYDINLNARLPRGGIASGGVSIGHEVTDICAVAGQASVTYAAVAGVAGVDFRHARHRPQGTTHVGRSRRARCTATSSHRIQPDVKGLVSYPAARGGASRRARRSRTGPVRRFWRPTP